MVEQVLLLIFGSEARNVPSMIDATYRIAGVDISGQRLLALGGGIAILAALWLFMQYTRLGSAILAVSQDAEAAQYMGIPSDRIFSLVMGLSAAIAAAAGILVAPFQTVIPSMGLLPLVKAFAIVVVGGLGSIPGSIVGALLLGYSETIIAFEVSIQWSQIVSVAAVFIALVLARPASSANAQRSSHHMRSARIDWFGAAIGLLVLGVAPLVFGSGYIIGVLTVALCFGIWAASWDFMSGLTGRENFGSLAVHWRRRLYGRVPQRELRG